MRQKGKEEVEDSSFAPENHLSVVSVSVTVGVSIGSAVDISPEAIVVSDVGNSSPGTIGLEKGVLTLDSVAITMLRCHLDVTGVVVVHSVGVLVFWVGLREGPFQLVK